MVLECQKKANKNWENKNREYSSYLKNRSSAKSFIRNKATLEDLDDLISLIEERKEKLKDKNEEI